MTISKVLDQHLYNCVMLNTVLLLLLLLSFFFVLLNYTDLQEMIFCMSRFSYKQMVCNYWTINKSNYHHNLTIVGEQHVAN